MTRITFGMVNANVQTALQENTQRLNDTMTKLSTGKLITRPSDDPVGTSSALHLRTQLAKQSQYYRNIQDGQGWLSTTETAMSTGNDTLQRVRELAIQGSNDTYTATQRKYLGTEVMSLLEETVALANTTYKGEYIFSGTQTQTPPYSLEDGTGRVTSVADANGQSLTAAPATVQIYDLSRTDSSTATGNPQVDLVVPGTLTISGLTEGTDYTVDYRRGTVTFQTATATALAAGAGIDMSFERVRKSELDLNGDIQREVQQGTTAGVNVTSDVAFGSGDDTVFDSIIGLMQGLHTNSRTEVQASIEPVDESMEAFLRAQTFVGSRVNRLQFTSDQNRTDNVSLTEESSRIEDVDYAKVISDYQNISQIYQASIKVGSEIIKPTLADYL